MLQLVSDEFPLPYGKNSAVRIVVVRRSRRSSAPYPRRRAVRSICPMHRRIVRRRALAHSRLSGSVFDGLVNRFVFESLDSNCSGCWDQDYDAA